MSPDAVQNLTMYQLAILSTELKALKRQAGNKSRTVSSFREARAIWMERNKRGNTAG